MLETLNALLRNRPFLQSNLIASAGTLFTLFLSYLFHFVMTRLLSTADYGDLSVIVGIFAVATIPAASISAALTRELSKLEALKQQKKMHFLLFKYLRTVTLLSFLLFGLMALGGWFLFDRWDLRLTAALVALGIPAAYYHNMASSYFQAKEKIVVLMGLGILRELFRFAFAVGLVWVGWGVVGAASSFPLGYFLVAGGVAWFFSRSLKGEEPYSLSLKRSFFLLLLTSFLSSTFMYLDLFFVKLHLGSAPAGLYNVAQVTSKLLVYLSAGITLVMFPKSSKLSYARHSHLLGQLVWKSSLFLMPALAVFLVFPQLLTFFYPAEYGVAVPAFQLLSVGMFFFAVFMILLNVMWSQHQEAFPLGLFFGGVAFHALLLNFAVPLWQLQGAAWATVVSSFLLLAASALKVHYSLRKAPKP